MKNFCGNRFLAVFLVAVMLVGFLPGGAIFPISSQALPLFAGDIVNAVNLTGTSTSYTITQVLPSGNQTIPDTGTTEVYLVEVTSSNATITVASNATAVLVLNGTSRSATTSPLQIGDNANVTIILMDNEKNTFTCTGASTGSTALQAGINVHPTATLTILGQTGNAGELIATGGLFSAGIGAGPNQNCGTIVIAGGIVTANSGGTIGTPSGNGAGIGGGGGNVGGGGNSAGITICGKAIVKATSLGDGAGIGGAGGGGTAYPANNVTSGGGSGGMITITDDAAVTAISERNGAGIGGGGHSANGSVGTAGAGGTITINGNATVEATANGNGAGIGGGGSGNTLAAGAGETITISGNPIVVTKTHSIQSSAVDIGPGVSANNTLGVTGTITITSGNVYADAAAPVKNGPIYGDNLLEMTARTSIPNSPVLQIIHAGTSNEYTYAATTNSVGTAYMWLPESLSGNFANITVTGVKNALGGQQLYQITFRVESYDMSPSYTLMQSVLPLLDPTWRLKSGEASKLTNINAMIDQSIELIYETGIESVTVYTKTYGTTTDILAPITIPNCVIDAPYSFLSPSIPGYQLVDSTGADLIPYIDTIATVDATNNKITFFYKVSNGNQVVIYRDADTHNVIGQTIISVPKGIATAVAIPNITNYTPPLTAQTVMWDGSTPLSPIIYDYTIAKATLTLEAYNVVTDTRIGTISYATAAQRVLEGYNYSSDITTLTNLLNLAYPGAYALTPQSHTVYYISTTSANNMVKVYYNPRQGLSGTIPVECRFGSQAGPLIHSYSIPTATGQILTLSMNQTPDLSGLGFAVDLAVSDLSATEGVTGDKIILVYIDNRFETNIKNNLDNIVLTDKTVPGQSIVLHPPYKAGYVATQYSIDNGVNKSAIPTGGYSANAATDIIFYYEAYNLLPTTGNLIILVTDAYTRTPLVGVTVSVSVDGGVPSLHYTDANGKVTFTAFGNYTVDVSHGGYQNATGSTTLNATNASQTMTITLAQRSSGGGGSGGNGGSIVIIEDSQTSTGDDRSPVSDVIQALLEAEQHIRYIQGYPDGTARPDSNITRAEVAAIFWRLLKNPDKAQTVSNSFHDVNGSEWYAHAVNYLASIDIITGYEDGSFQPNRNITRAEFAAMISRFDTLEDNTIQPFGDVPEDHWANDFITSSYLKGWINGYPGMVFLPENHITRAETVKIVNFMLGRGIKTEDVPSQLCDLYSDLPITHWAFTEVIEASVIHNYERRHDGYEIYK